MEFLSRSEAMEAGLEVPDIYYAPGYGASAEQIDGGMWECAVADGGTCVFPYLRRSIGLAPDRYDIVSPYGYGGVVAGDADRRADFVREFRLLSKERGLVAEFLRANPFDVTNPAVDGHQVDMIRRHPTFTVELETDALDSYWDACAGRHRTAVRKSTKEGLQVVDADPAELEHADGSFRRLYDTTMDRVGSSTRLKLPDEYYRRLRDGLGSSVRVVEARLHGEPVAASIFLLWRDRLHYHLSGSTPGGMRAGATNAVLDHAVRTLMPRPGRLHLGGGVSPGDGLERFKRSVANRVTTVHLCSTVVDRVAYDELVAASGADPATDYFPAYRA